MKKFLWGVALSEYQNSGAVNCPNSNWAYWEQKNKQLEPSGISTDFWHLYQKDINLITDLAINSLRFSIEWSKIEPQEGQFNQEALDYYLTRCKMLIAAGITPMVTLHHFTHPEWFEELGGFEHGHNIDYFIRFCIKVFSHLSPYIDLWGTINEPAIYAFQGYIRGVFPPGKKNIFTALRVLKNLMKAHTGVYKALKNLPNGDRVQIGFIHQCLTFRAYNKRNSIEKITAYLLNRFVNELTLDFCRTGNFSVYMPLIFKTSYKVPDTQKICDFMGINYYTQVLIKSNFNIYKLLESAYYPHEIKTDMPFAIYSRGLLTAIEKVAALGVPIYITENGIADADDTRRKFFLEQHIAMLQHARDIGYTICGYYYWTLVDNYEWDLGYSMKFGLYSVDLKTQTRYKRPSADYYKQLILSKQAEWGPISQ